MKIDIDYVVPMVFPNDPKWRYDYLAATGSFCDDRSTLSSPRFRSWGTEELLIRCIRKNLPWIRTIYVVLARESQAEYMERLYGLNGQDGPSTPKIRFVYHRDFIPADKLPTFNSRAIEMYLHRIPDLAPYFLYGNDDMFPLSPMPVEDFFRDGLPCLHFTKKAFNPSNAFHQACMNGLNFVAAQFGQHFNDYWLRVGHNVVPIVKATCEMFWERWPKQMQASVTRFRLPQNYNQYVYSWWQILSGQYIDHRPPRCYIAVDTPADDIREAIRTADGLLCINDNKSVNDIANLAAVVRSEIQQRL